MKTGNFFIMLMLVLTALASCEESKEELFEMGLSAYQNGDYSTAVEYYQKAASQGHGKANLALGVMYEEGIGVERSNRRAFEYYYEANLCLDPMGTFKTGLCYLNGWGVPENEMVGIDFIVKAAEWGLKVAKDFCDERNIAYDHLKATQNRIE